jgi:SpoIVB peptidase S55
MRFSSYVPHQALPVLGGGAGLVLTLVLGLPKANGQAAQPTIPTTEIREGMKGYGLSVFKGTEPEKFDVEVIGVLKNFRPSQDLILIKTPHPRLNITKAVRGMSGSPIYFNGRLAGAYAYSLGMFSAEPLAGVTPIAPMLAELHRPIPKGFWPIEGSGPVGSTEKRATLDNGAEPSQYASSGPTTITPSSTQFRGEPGMYNLEEHRKELADRLAPLPASAKSFVPVATPVMIGGVGERTQAYVRTLFAPLGLEPLAAGGGSSDEKGAPEHFVNGGSLGVSMVSGDVSFFGLGTVTHVEGRRLAGFGHPMMEAGVSALPTAISRVHWIFASDQISNKIGESIRPLGALVQDRQSAVVADETVTAPTFPLHVEIKGAPGAPKTVWNMTVAEEKFMTPGFVAAAMSGAFEATANERRDVTWKLNSKLSVRGHGTIELEDIGIASGGLPEGGEWGRSRLIRAIGETLNNPWEHTRITGVEATLTVEYAKNSYQLRGVELLDPVVDPGEKARVRLRLLTAQGPAITKVIEVMMPTELAGKEVDVELFGGYEAAPDVPAPENLRQLLSNISKASPPRTLVAQIRLPGQGVTFASHVAPRLPPFALDALKPQNSDGGPETYGAYVRTFIPLDKFFEGRDRVRVRVRPGK